MNEVQPIVFGGVVANSLGEFKHLVQSGSVTISREPRLLDICKIGLQVVQGVDGILVGFHAGSGGAE